jgi:hypothetical protein
MADRYYGMAFDNTERDGNNDDGAAGSVDNVQRQLDRAYPVTVESAVENAAEMVNRLSALWDEGNKGHKSQYNRFGVVIRNVKGDWVSFVIVKSKRVVEYFNPRGRPSPDEDAVVLVFLKKIVSFVRNLKSPEGAAGWNVAMSRVQHQRLPVDYGMYALIHQTSGMTL